MAEVINLITIEEGATISTVNGATAEVVSNPKDGVWVFVKYLTSPEDPDLVGTEDMVFAQDICRSPAGSRVRHDSNHLQN